MTTCVHCRHDNPPGEKLCANCGEELAGSGGHDAFEAELQAMVEAGQKIAAIKLYREQTGAGLAEAKEAVESIARGELPAAAAEPNRESAEQEIVDLLRERKKIAAVKRYREQHGGGLKEAKQAVDALEQELGITSSAGGCLGVALVFFLMGWLTILYY